MPAPFCHLPLSCYNSPQKVLTPPHLQAVLLSLSMSFQEYQSLCGSDLSPAPVGNPVRPGGGTSQMQRWEQSLRLLCLKNTGA